MKFKSKIKFAVSFLSVLLFSAPIFGQSGNLNGKWILLSFTENGDADSLFMTESRKKISLVGNQTVKREINARLWLTKDSFTITPACNSKNGKYKIIKPGRINFTPQLTTAKACSLESDVFDKRLVRALSNVVKYKIRNKILTLQDASGRTVLTFSSER